MATANPFQTIRLKAGDERKTMDWYQSQIRTLSRASTAPNKLMQNTPMIVDRIMPGRMYMFFYDPKFKDTLPYYDMFPLVLPFHISSDSFHGINLHYLPYVMRFKLLGALHSLAVEDGITEENRLRISWKLLQGMSRVAPIKACVKQYLKSHVQSRFLNIKYPDWITAAMLPVERFEGATKNAVWEDSKRERF